MTKYYVTFTETYEYSKTVELDDSLNIEEVVRDPLQFPMIKDMSREQVDALAPFIQTDYRIMEVKKHDS